MGDRFDVIGAGRLLVGEVSARSATDTDDRRPRVPQGLAEGGSLPAGQRVQEFPAPAVADRLRLDPREQSVELAMVGGKSMITFSPWPMICSCLH